MRSWHIATGCDVKLKLYAMKRVSIILLCVCLSTSVYSQGVRQGAVPAQPRDVEAKEEIDRLLLRFTYRVRIATDTVKNSDGHYYDNQALEIGENFNRYYSLFAENMDSVKFKAKGAGGEYDPAVNLHLDEYGTYEDIFFNYPDKGEITVYNKFHNTVYEYSEPVPSLHWDISSRTDTVLGYECFMAEAEFRGRFWRAWFTYEIPMPYGPWKLGGLPGLILKAEDTDSLFVFEMVGISDFRNGDMHIYRYDERTRKCKREDILKLNDMRGAASGQLNEMHGVKGSVTYMLADPVTGEKKEISYGEMMALVGDVLYIPQMENE